MTKSMEFMQKGTILDSKMLIWRVSKVWNIKLFGLLILDEKYNFPPDRSIILYQKGRLLFSFENNLITVSCFCQDCHKRCPFKCIVDTNHA